MKLLFIHSSEKVKKDDTGQLYTDGSYSKEVWDNYFEIFDEITIVMREDTQKYTCFEASSRFNRIPEKIEFVPISDSNKSIKAHFDHAEKIKRNRIIENEIEKADAIIVRMPGTAQAIDMAKKHNKKCLVEVVGCPFDSLRNHSWKGKVLAIPAYFRMKKAMEVAPNSIYVTNEFLQKRYPTKGSYISCSDVKIEDSNSELLERRLEKIKSESEKLIIGTASGIGVRYKGQQFVIRALGLLKREGIEDFEYQIAGNGDTSYLQSEIEKNDVNSCVKFVGSIPHDKMPEWYGSLDIYIQPSLQEGMPRALIEAMSCALPCAGSDVGGIPELLNKEVLFKKGSVEQIKAVLSKMREIKFREIQAERSFIRSKDFERRLLEKKRLDYMKKVFEVQ